MKIFWLVSLLIFFIDRITKLFVINLNFPEDKTTWNIFFCLNLTKVWNKGIVFGFLNQVQISPLIIIFFTLLVLIMIYIWTRKVWRVSKDKILMIGLGMIFGGGMGNLFDRILWGAVFDFLDFYVEKYHWPAFNFADVGITVGIGIVIFKHFFKNSNL